MINDIRQVKPHLQIVTLTFCNFYCIQGEKGRGVVIYIGHLYLDHSHIRKPGNPSICGLHNQAGLEKNQGMFYTIQEFLKNININI
jgi:hypothetical protein